MTYLSVRPQYARTHFPAFSNWFDTVMEREFDAVRTRALVNTKETKDSYVIEVAAPGFSKDSFKLAVHENVLTISAEKNADKTDESEKYTMKEYHYEGFKRSFTLPKTVAAEKIAAEYKDGVLLVSLPKMEENKAKGAIEIKVS